MSKLSKIALSIFSILTALSLMGCYTPPQTVDNPPFSYVKIDASATSSSYYLSEYDKQADLVDNVTVGGELNGLKISGLGSLSFRRCDNISKVTLLDTVTHIGEHSFSQSSLTVINMSSKVNEIGPHAFNSCSNLTSVNLQNTSITAISDGTFYKCTSLTSISIPSGVTSIGEYAFDGCTQLRTVYIPRSVTYLNVGCLKSLYVSGDSACQIRYEGSQDEWNAIEKAVGESYDDFTAGEPMYWYGMGELLYDISYNCTR